MKNAINNQTYGALYYICVMKLKEIRTSAPEYAFLESLFVEAFPRDERRDLEAQRRNVDCEPAFHCCVVEHDGEAVGLFNYWDFGRWTYCEHFAISGAVRSHGYGAQAIGEALRHTGKPMVLEVEMPGYGEMARRRIGFYRRQGFILLEDVEYMQPPYRPGDGELPMMLMTTDPGVDIDEVIATLRRRVYGVAPGQSMS